MRIRGRCPPSDSDYKYLSGQDEYNKPYCKINLIVERGYKNFELSYKQQIFRKNSSSKFERENFDGVDIRNSPINLELLDQSGKSVFSLVKTCHAGECYLNFSHPIDILTAFSVAVAQLSSVRNATNQL